jgi:hypothetical protein
MNVPGADQFGFMQHIQLSTLLLTTLMHSLTLLMFFSAELSLILLICTDSKSLGSTIIMDKCFLLPILLDYGLYFCCLPSSLSFPILWWVWVLIGNKMEMVGNLLLLIADNYWHCFILFFFQ